MSTECSVINMQIFIRWIAIFVHDSKHHYRKLRKVTIITIAFYKYNYKTTQPKLKNEPQSKKKLFTGARYISST